MKNKTEKTKYKLPKKVNRFEFQESSRGIHQPIGKSEAVPGQAYTVKELLIKHRYGDLPQIGSGEPIYDDPENMETNPTLSPDFDFAEAHELKKQAKQKIQSAKKKLSEEQQKNKEHDKYVRTSVPKDEEKMGDSEAVDPKSESEDRGVKSVPEN